MAANSRLWSVTMVSIRQRTCTRRRSCSSASTIWVVDPGTTQKATTSGILPISHTTGQRRSWYVFRPPSFSVVADHRQVIHSELDYRLCISEALAAFNCLQARKVPSKLLVFPDENHVSFYSRLEGWLIVLRQALTSCPVGFASRELARLAPDRFRLD